MSSYFDKELFDRIANGTCRYKELKKFVKNIDAKTFDTDKPFEKYYKVKSILYTIDCYEKKQVNKKYFSAWMVAYNWIIMGGFYSDESYDECVDGEKKNVKTTDGDTTPDMQEITFREWLQWKISDVVDSLSFFDCDLVVYDLKEYKECFVVLDKIYNDVEQWKRIFAHTDECGGNDEDVVVLAYNEATREYVKIYGWLDDLHYKVEIDKVEQKILDEEVKKLENVGYAQLKIGFE